MKKGHRELIASPQKQTISDQKDYTDLSTFLYLGLAVLGDALREGESIAIITCSEQKNKRNNSLFERVNFALHPSLS